MEVNEDLNSGRTIKPEDILLPPGYRIEPVFTGLNTPISMAFNETGQLFIADSGVIDGNGKVLMISPEGTYLVADGFNPPLTGITLYKGKIFVSHRGFVTTIDENGVKNDVLAGLPSFGDHHNNKVEFSSDGMMYFGQGTATNSGVVGLDNLDWVKGHPFFHDYPGENSVLAGRNYVTMNPLTFDPDDRTVTGAFSPFTVSTDKGEVIKGIIKASGSVLRAEPDGLNLQLVAWGLRNPFRMQFDRNGVLWCANHGMDVRGSRPVANSPDEFYWIYPGAWYGWLDFTGGYPVTLPYYKPEGEQQPDFLLMNHPTQRMPRPLALFVPHSANMGFAFSYVSEFGFVGDAFIAQFGSEAPRTTGGVPLPSVGHRVARIDMHTGAVFNFAVNRSGLPASLTEGGGLERPIDVVFGPDGHMYILDWGIVRPEEHHGFVPNTGVLWRVKRN